MKRKVLDRIVFAVRIGMYCRPDLELEDLLPCFQLRPPRCLPRVCCATHPGSPIEHGLAIIFVIFLDFVDVPYFFRRASRGQAWSVVPTGLSESDAAHLLRGCAACMRADDDPLKVLPLAEVIRH